MSDEATRVDAEEAVEVRVQWDDEFEVVSDDKFGLPALCIRRTRVTVAELGYHPQGWSGDRASPAPDRWIFVDIEGPGRRRACIDALIEALIEIRDL